MQAPVPIADQPEPKSTLRLLKLEDGEQEPARPPRTIQASRSTQKGPPRPDAIGLTVARRLAQVLRPLYGDRLAGIYLYGARARGDSKPDSDVEVLVVLDSIERYGEELERTSATCASLSLEFDLVVSRVLISENTWRDRTDGRLLAVRSEVVPL
jgi:predicted nucleotidyltransferase